MKAERERSKTQMKDLELQLSEMHDELDRAKKAELVAGDRDALLKVKSRLRRATDAVTPGPTRCPLSVRMWRSCATTVRRCCSRRRSRRSCFATGRRS